MPGQKKKTAGNTYETYEKNNKKKKATAATVPSKKIILPTAKTKASSTGKKSLNTNGKLGVSGTTDIGGKAIVLPKLSSNRRSVVNELPTASSAKEIFGKKKTEEQTSSSTEMSDKVNEMFPSINKKSTEETTPTAGPRAPGAFATTKNSTYKADQAAKKQEYNTGLEEAGITSWTDNPVIGAGKTYSDSFNSLVDTSSPLGTLDALNQSGAKESADAAYQAKKEEWLNNRKNAGEWVDAVDQNWDNISDEDKYNIAVYGVSVLGLTAQTEKLYDYVMENSTGQAKADLVAALVSYDGITDKTQPFIDQLNNEETTILKQQLASFMGGEEKLNEYLDLLSQQKKAEYAKEWSASGNYNSEDSHLEHIMGALGQYSVGLTDQAAMAVSYYLQNKDNYLNVKSPFEGVDWSSDPVSEMFQVGANTVFSVLNLAGDTIRPLVNGWVNDSNAQKLGYENADEWVAAITDELMSKTDKYYEEHYLMEVKTDAADFSDNFKKAMEVEEMVVSQIPAMITMMVNPTAGLTAFGTSASGTYARQAYESGASLDDALVFGTMAGLAEVGTEKLFTGFGWAGKGFANRIAAKTGTKALQTSTMEALNNFKASAYGQALMFFVHAGAEASEEMIMEVLQNYMERATYDPGAQNATWEDIKSAGEGGAIVSAVLGIPYTAANVTSTTQNKVYKKAVELDINNQLASAIDEIKAKVSAGEMTEAEAQYSIEEITENSQIYIDQLKGKGALGETSSTQAEDKQKISTTVQVADSAGKALSYLKESAKGKKVGDTVSVAFTENGQVKVYTATVGKNGITAPMVRNANAQESRDVQNKIEALAKAETETRQSGIQNNVKDYVINLAEELSKATGKKVTFITEEAYKKNGKTYTEQGSAADDTIYINAASKNPTNQIFAHELTHTLEKNKAQYDELKKITFDWYKSSLEAERSRVFGMYARAGKELKGQDEIDSEIIARFVEKKLLTDEETILNLVRVNRTFAQRVLDWINSAIQRLVGRKEQKFLVEARQQYRKLLDADRAKRAENVTGKMETVREKSENVHEKEKTSEEDVKYSVEEQKDISHIKEQIADNIDILNKMEPVANITREPFENMKAKSNVSIILRELKSKGYEIDRQDFGIIHFGPNEINRGWDYTNNNAERLSFFAVHNVLKRGVEIKSRADHRDRRYSSVTFAAPVIINGERGNLAVVVIQTKGNRYKAHRILSPDGTALMLDNTKSTEPTPGEGGQNAVFSPISSVLDTKVSQKEEGVKGKDWQKEKYSITEEDDSQYMQAVESGDMETAQQMVDAAAEKAMTDSKVRDENGKLRKLFHGTSSDDFTVFDNKYVGMASGDTGFFGMGFYFAFTEAEAKYYGSRVLAAYTNLKNPFYFQETLYDYEGDSHNGGFVPYAIFVARMAEVFPDLVKEQYVNVADPGSDQIRKISFAEFAAKLKDVYDNVTFKVQEIESQSYGKEYLALADRTVHKYTDNEGNQRTYVDYGYKQRYLYEKDANSQIANAYQYLEKNVYSYISLDSPKQIIMDLDFTGELKRQGYDGVLQSKHGDEVVAFYSEQIKSADPITYDDEGKVIPLSERFDANKKDIRYSIEEESFKTLEEALGMTSKELNEYLKNSGDPKQERLRLERAYGINTVKPYTPSKKYHAENRPSPTKEENMSDMSADLDELLKDFDKEFVPKEPKKVNLNPVVTRVFRHAVPYMYEGKQYGEWTGREYNEAYITKREFKWYDSNKKEWLNEADLIQKIKEHEAPHDMARPHPPKSDDFFIPGDEVYLGKDRVIIDRGVKTPQGHTYTVEYTDGMKVDVAGSALTVVPSNGSAVLQGLKSTDIEAKKQINDIVAGLKHDLGYRTHSRKELNDLIRGVVQKIMIRGFYNPSDVTKILESAYASGVEVQPLSEVQKAAKEHLDGMRFYITEDIRGELQSYGGMVEINRRMMGNNTRFTTKRQESVGLDEGYSELNVLYPDLFPADVDASDQISYIIEMATAKRDEKSFERIDNELLEEGCPPESTMKATMERDIESAFQQLATLYDQANTELDQFRSEPTEEIQSFDDLDPEAQAAWEEPPAEWDVVNGYEDITDMEPPSAIDDEDLDNVQDTVSDSEKDPRTETDYVAMMDEFGDQIRERNEEELEEEWEWTRWLTSKGVSYLKHYARNFDAASRNNAKIRKKLDELFTNPFVHGKTGYVNGTRDKLNNLYDEMHKLGIKMDSRESAAIMKYGEGYYLKPTKAVDPITGQKYIKNVRVKYTFDDLKKEFPFSYQKIVLADKYFRQIYDNYIDQINEARASIYGNVKETHLQKMREVDDKYAFYKKRMEEAKEKRQSIGITLAAKKQQLKETKTAKAKAILGKSIRYNEDRLSSAEEQLERARNEMGMQRSIYKAMEEEERNGEYLKNKMLLPRKNYYHHMRKESSYLEEIIGASRNMSEIDPMLEGISAYTQPKSKWSKILAHQGKGMYELDAIKSMIDYVQTAEYMIHMDPAVAKIRDNVGALAQATKESRNANKLIRWLVNWTNDLSGKTADHFDRYIQDRIGRDAMRRIRKLNGKVKGNAVVGNVNSMLAQFFNLPNAFGYILNPFSWSEGLLTYTQWVCHGNSARELIRQSTFLNERYLDDVLNRFDQNIMAYPKKLAVWGLTFGDRHASLLIWCAAYNDAIMRGIENPIRHADDITERSVAGRGVGEVPLQQKALWTQVVAPFQIEVNNAWQVYKEKAGGVFKSKSKTKKVKSALGFTNIMTVSFMMNTVTDLLVGRRVVMDPIYVMVEAISEWMASDDDDDVDWKERIKELVGRMAGEVIGAMPYGSLIAYYVVNNPWDRIELFGEDYDPTRYGVGNIAIDCIEEIFADISAGDKNLTDNMISVLTTFVTPWGGKQLERLINGVQNFGWVPKPMLTLEGFDLVNQPTAGLYGEDGALKFPVETFSEDPWQAFKALVFGPYTTESGQEYIDEGFSKLNDRETAAFNALVEEGADRWEVYNTIREMKSCENDSQKREVLMATEHLTDDELVGLYLNAVIGEASMDSELEKINAVVGSSQTFKQYLADRNKYSELVNSDVYTKAKEKNSQFISWMVQQGYNADQIKATVNALPFYSASAYTSTAFTEVSGSLDSEKSAEVTNALAALKPLEGADAVSDLQKWEAIAGMEGFSEAEKNIAMAAAMDDAQYKKFTVATESGATAQIYVNYKKALVAANTDGNSNYNQDETKAALDSLNASNAVKSALWQITNKSWKPSNNPYGNSTAVQEKLYAEETEEETSYDRCPLDAACVDSDPTDGEYYVSSGYGWRSGTIGSKYHQAVDLACPVGTSVKSVMNGTVTSITNDPDGYGLSIEITDEEGNVEKYSHLSTVSADLDVGSKVSANTQIAESGNSGLSEGPHLDFKYKKDGQWVDPTLYFNIGNGTYKGSSGGYTAGTYAAGSSGGSSGGGGGGSSSSGTSQVSSSDHYANMVASSEAAAQSSSGSSGSGSKTVSATSGVTGGIVLPTAGSKMSTSKSTTTGVTGATAATASTAATTPTLESILSGMTDTSWS